jgi:hypothetical protein
VNDTSLTLEFATCSHDPESNRMNTVTGDSDAPICDRSDTVDDGTTHGRRDANVTDGGDRSSTNDALAFAHIRPDASTHVDTTSKTPSPPIDTFTHRATALTPSTEPALTSDHATLPFTYTRDVTLLASDTHNSTSLASRLYGGGGRGSHVDGAAVSTIVLTLSSGDGDTLPAASMPSTSHT